MNQIRIRIVDLNYNVYADTYSTDYGKTIINSKVFDTVVSHKTAQCMIISLEIYRL